MKYLVKIITVSFLLFWCIVFSIICFPHNVFYQSYDNLIQDKYRILLETNDPKIIIISGSSAAFGINQRMLEDATGYKVSNLGLHAGLGYLFTTELAKQNINKGDIVLLGYEYGWEKDDGFKKIGVEHVMAGIDDNIAMYGSLLMNFPAEIWEKCLGYIFDFAKMKNLFESYEGTYSRASFDLENAQMIVNRSESFEWSYAPNNIVDSINYEISEYSREYIRNLKEFVRQKGAYLYFIAPPLAKDAVCCSTDDFYKLKYSVEKVLGIEYISDPVQYFYSCDLMYDTIYHCNSEGEEVRTQMLIGDLKRANAY